MMWLNAALDLAAKVLFALFMVRFRLTQEDELAHAEVGNDAPRRAPVSTKPRRPQGHRAAAVTPTESSRAGRRYRGLVARPIEARTRRRASSESSEREDDLVSTTPNSDRAPSPRQGSSAPRNPSWPRRTDTAALSSADLRVVDATYLPHSYAPVGVGVMQAVPGETDMTGRMHSHGMPYPWIGGGWPVHYLPVPGTAAATQQLPTFAAAPFSMTSPQRTLSSAPVAASSQSLPTTPAARLAPAALPVRGSTTTELPMVRPAPDDVMKAADDLLGGARPAPMAAAPSGRASAASVGPADHRGLRAAGARLRELELDDSAAQA